MRTSWWIAEQAVYLKDPIELCARIGHQVNANDRIAELFLVVFDLLATFWKDLNEQSIYVLDSFRVAACDNYRIPRSRSGRLGEPQRVAEVRVALQEL